jgi:hypothetical protein
MIMMRPLLEAAKPRVAGREEFKLRVGELEALTVTVNRLR